MAKAFLIFPHQLFEENYKQSKDFKFYLVEDALYFSQYKFHKQKIVLHRASMKYYEAMLRKKKFTVTYLDQQHAETMDLLFKKLSVDGIDEVVFRDLSDDWLEQRLYKAAKKYNIRCQEISSPMFLTDKVFLHEYFSNKKTFHMADFYMAQRKRWNILMDGNKPTGGKWSFDTENRKKLPKKIIIPEIYFPSSNIYVKEAQVYTASKFADNYGASQFIYGVTHADAKRCLENFIELRFSNFGIYEDAIASGHDFLFHSVLTPYLNTGLLTPAQVLEAILERAKDIPLNSQEGFIRQVIGWREYMRAVYLLKGRRERTKNFWNHTRKIPYSFWNATTGILPVDNTIKKVLTNAYSHHIERLMVMGNFMMLCEFDPDEIYRWFMEMYIDAYDWVMVPNVYSMSQYAGGGTTTTKPYISSSNYILKMSDYPKGDWTGTWDALYWRFINEHKNFFSENPRLSVMSLHLNKMDKSKLNAYYSKAEKFLETLALVN